LDALDKDFVVINKRNQICFERGMELCGQRGMKLGRIKSQEAQEFLDNKITIKKFFFEGKNF